MGLTAELPRRIGRWFVVYDDTPARATQPAGNTAHQISVATAASVALRDVDRITVIEHRFLNSVDVVVLSEDDDGGPRRCSADSFARRAADHRRASRPTRHRSGCSRLAARIASCSLEASAQTSVSRAILMPARVIGLWAINTVSGGLPVGAAACAVERSRAAEVPVFDASGRAVASASCRYRVATRPRHRS